MQDRDTIHQYLKSLSKYLSRLGKNDAEEVIKEIESHIYDVMQDNESNDLPINAKEILAGFGEPRELASQYVAHILEGEPPPKGFRAIQRVKKGATWGLYVATAIFGYGIALALTLLALYKPFAPDEVGLWSQGEGHSFALGVIPIPREGYQEILGWWIIPVTLILALGIAYLTRRLLRIVKLQI